jgi:hypothetical protein
VPDIVAEPTNKAFAPISNEPVDVTPPFKERRVAVDAPRPETEDNVSASVEVTVYVEPDAEIVVMPAPVSVKVPPSATEPVPELPANEIEEFCREAFGRLDTFKTPEVTDNPVPVKSLITSPPRANVPDTVAEPAKYACVPISKDPVDVTPPLSDNLVAVEAPRPVTDDKVSASVAVSVMFPPSDTAAPPVNIPALFIVILEFVRSTLATLPLTIDVEFTDAVPISPVVPETWNNALPVADPPTTKSFEISKGATTPLALCQ